MKNGFTLMELLAVIIILALLFFVTIPVMTDIVKDSKKKAYIINTESYVNSLKSIISSARLERKTNLDGIYLIQNDGSLCKETTACEEKIEVDVSGKYLTSGIVVIKNGDFSLSYYDTKEEVTVFKTIDSNKIGTAKLDLESSTSISIIKDDNSGLYMSQPGRYVYRGENPNNYIWIDENGDNIKQTENSSSELYRIISYEADGIIKVIRDNSIGTKEWDTTVSPTRQNEDNEYCNYEGTYKGCNAYGTQNDTYLEGTLLENTFYYKYYNEAYSATLLSSTSGTVTIPSTLNKFLNNNWLSSKTNLNQYIETHLFNVGGSTGINRSLSDEKYQENLSKWLGKIGLMTATEYVEGSINNSCTNIYVNSYYNPDYYINYLQTNEVWPCKDGNYLYKENNEWTISASSYSQNLVWYVSSLGFLNISSTFTENNVRPVFYLKSSVELSGNGTIDSPYEIVM